ncbi:MAG: hypothetical protein H7835_01070 [Magnetococcus sp. XQGC-1]
MRHPLPGPQENRLARKAPVLQPPEPEPVQVRAEAPSPRSGGAGRVGVQEPGALRKFPSQPGPTQRLLSGQTRSASRETESAQTLPAEPTQKSPQVRQPTLAAGWP